MERVKCVVVGDGCVGKTSLIKSFMSGTFSEGFSPPTVFEMDTRIVNHSGREILLNIHDTAGMSGFERLRPLSYPDCDVFVICFSLASHFSLESVLDNWFPEVRRYRPQTPIILVGTKSDLKFKACQSIEKCRFPSPVEESEVLNVKQKIKSVDYVECSARTSTGVNEVFYSAVWAALYGKKMRHKKIRLCKLQ